MNSGSAGLALTGFGVTTHAQSAAPHAHGASCLVPGGQEHDGSTTATGCGAAGSAV